MPPSKTNPKQKKVKDIGRIATSETLPVVTTNHTQNGLDAILIYPSLVWLSLSLDPSPPKKNAKLHGLAELEVVARVPCEANGADGDDH